MKKPAGKSRQIGANRGKSDYMKVKTVMLKSFYARKLSFQKNCHVKFRVLYMRTISVKEVKYENSEELGKAGFDVQNKQKVNIRQENEIFQY
jgi:hypothetical protein